MKHICYFYIFKYRSIKNMGISLDARYAYDMDEEEKVLTIEKNDKYIDGFWPTGISSLTALVGNNGAGKTSYLEYMLYVLAEGEHDRDKNAIIVYEEEDGLHAYMPSKCEYKVQSMDPSIKCTTSHRRVHTGMFYYSSYFRSYASVSKPRDGELAGVYNATDTWRLVKDLQDYSNLNTLSGTKILRRHLSAMRAQDNNRIVQLLSDNELRNLLPKDAFPNYVILNPNESGYDALSDKQQGEKKLVTRPRYIVTNKEIALARIIYYNFYNIIAELGENGNSIIYKYRDEWNAIFRKKKNALISYEIFLNRYPDIHVRFTQLLNIIKFISKAFEYDHINGTLYLDLLDEQNKNNIIQLMAYFRLESFVVAHFFDMGFAHEHSADTQLSSGEHEMLKFFSRLYDSTELTPSKISNIYTPPLLLIDEAENSYHPEWQKKFVNILVNFVHALYVRLKQKTIFQIVLTTHSPILLSDIPSEYVNYLKKDGKNMKVVKNQPETFGANIFELYRYSFFMSNGLVGEFAQQKIERIQDHIKSGKMSLEDICKEINLIGDKGIRTYLMTMLEECRDRDMLSYYRQKVGELERRVHGKD